MRFPLQQSASDNDSLATQPPSGRLPTLRLPTRLGVQFQLFWFYSTQRRAGRPRSSPLPLRGNCRLRRRWAFWFCQCVSRPAVCEYAVLVLPMRFPPRSRRAIMIYWRRNRPAVGCPPYVLTLSMLFF
ncbi:MAG: hypothetical protein LBQ66_00715 [Planctomycetaceae bacterium]|nr:hypothetical protein [Planctomycetaceae bacterium]